jgi:hypothetical protein
MKGQSFIAMITSEYIWDPNVIQNYYATPELPILCCKNICVASRIDHPAVNIFARRDGRYPGNVCTR